MIGLFDNFFQTIGPIGLKFSWFDGRHPGVVIRSLVKIGVKHYHGAIFKIKFSGCGHNSMPEETIPFITNHNCENTEVSKAVPKPLLVFFSFFFTSFLAL